MANIRTDVTYTIVDGAEIIFKAPCDSCTVTGLKVYYPNSDGIIVNEVFVFKDAHGNDLTDLDTFKTDAMVKVILNTTDHTAYIQNANTNAYLEGRFDGKADVAHNQAASTITAGTFGGQVKANATAQATLTTAQLRDAVFVAEASAPAVGSTADTSKYPEGCLIVLVEAVS